MTSLTASNACRKRSVPTADALDEQTLHRHIAQTLEDRFAGLATSDELSRIATEAIDRHRTAGVRNFVPILAQRYALELAHHLIDPDQTP